jgi:hypothetical protein
VARIESPIELKLKSPLILDNVFEARALHELAALFSHERVKSFKYEDFYSRYITSDNSTLELKKFHNYLLNLAREVFQSPTLLPTYACFAHYEGPNANLFKHKDTNACTYTVDFCLSQITPWDLWVEGKPYTLHPNQALAYYGNDQQHWREEFTNKQNNRVQMIFFHFAEPHHWFFTEGPQTISPQEFKKLILERREKLKKI